MSPPTADVAGAVLTGGRSRRFGRDKATEPVDGVAMAARVAAALRAGGVRETRAIGGDPAALGRLGLTVVPDRHPGEGPLGAVLTALAATEAVVVVVAACDLPWLDGPTVATVLAALADPAVEVAVAHTDRVEPLLSAWRVEAARPVVAAAFAAGERSMLAALDRLAVVEVPVPARPLTNVNRPGDLPG